MTACSTSNVDKVTDRVSTDSALCEGLKDPVDKFADAVLRNHKNTPDEVIIEGTKVIKGYDAGCS
jgi:hypothetical protein